MEKSTIPLSKRTKLALVTLGQLIKTSRLARKMSQEDLAKRLNITRLTVISIEKGNANVRIGTVFEAAAIVGVSLLGEDIEQLRTTSNAMTGFISVLPKRAGRKKRELNDDF